MPRAVPHPCNWRGCGAVTTERYCERHAEEAQRRVDRERGSAARRGYDRRWRALRELHLDREPLCRKCLSLGIVNGGSAEHPNEVDHIVPRVQGGSDDDDNLQTLCWDHHREKTRRETGWN